MMLFIDVALSSRRSVRNKNSHTGHKRSSAGIKRCFTGQNRKGETEQTAAPDGSLDRILGARHVTMSKSASLDTTSRLVLG